MNRPSDAAMDQALREIMVPYGIEDSGRVLAAVYSRARELDAAAAPVVVGEDVMAKAWRNLYIAERMRSIEFEGMSYEMRRAHAEASANDFEDEFRERMAKPAAKTAMGGLTAALAGD